jgi:hypothetical protein
MKRRFKICDEQVTEIVKGLRLRLMQLLEERQDLEVATHALHTLHWMIHRYQSRLSYPRPVT